MTTMLLLLLIFYLLLKGIWNHFQLNVRMRYLRFYKTYVSPLIIFLLLTATGAGQLISQNVIVWVKIFSLIFAYVVFQGSLITIIFILIIPPALSYFNFMTLSCSGLNS